MVSDMGLVTVAELEKFAILDYSTIDATLTDTIIDGKISDAEVFVCSIVGRDYTAEDLPDAVKLAIKTVAKKMMENYLIELGYDQNEKLVYSEEYIDPNLSLLLEPFVRIETNLRRMWIR